MLKILFAYFSFIALCLVVITTFITATTFTQLAIAIILYPPVAFLIYKFFPFKIHKSSNIEMPGPVKPDEEETTAFQISDADKRVFLKLIGSAGVFLFIMSIFNKRAEGQFFKGLPMPGDVSLKDSSGKRIDPAQKQSLDDYNISDIDNGIITFYGFIKKDGSWYIMRVDTNTGTFRYSKGEANFSGNWDNRQNLKYDLFNNVFSATK